jgi:serine/threonine-protein kinase
VVGTAQYLSPEQARGETVDSRSDVYSTGCLLYELLTGRPPFVGDSPVAVAYQHVREPAAPPSDLDDQLDAEIDAIVMKSLAKRVEDRYQSASAMRADIERYLAGHPIQAPAVVPAPATEVVPAVPPADGTSTMGAARTGGQPPTDGDRGSRTGLLVLLGLLVIGLIAAAAFLLPRMFESENDEVQVPNLVGLTEQEARLKIADAGLTVGQVDPEPSDTVEVDLVIRQDPNRDLYVSPDTAVDLVVSTGRPEVEVPYLVGQTRQAARDTLTGLGFTVKMQEEDSDEPKNQVLRTDPVPGTQAEDGSTVTVFYSDGPARIPDVVGLDQAAAEQAIRDAGFRPDAVPYGDTTEPAGTVVRQSPSGGTGDQGDTVTIFVSTYEPPPETPTETPTETPPAPTAPPTTPTETPPVPTETPSRTPVTPSEGSAG